MKKPDAPLTYSETVGTIAFLLAELVDEHMPYGDLLRLVRSVRQSRIEAEKGLAEDFVSDDLAMPVWRLTHELLHGRGMYPDDPDPAMYPDDQG